MISQLLIDPGRICPQELFSCLFMLAMFMMSLEVAGGVSRELSDTHGSLLYTRWVVYWHTTLQQQFLGCDLDLNDLDSNQTLCTRSSPTWLKPLILSTIQYWSEVTSLTVYILSVQLAINLLQSRLSWRSLRGPTLFQIYKKELLEMYFLR